jgi:hypothetical protein
VGHQLATTHIEEGECHDGKQGQGTQQAAEFFKQNVQEQTFRS